MNEVSKIRILVGLVAILVLLNVAMLGYLWCVPQGGEKRGPGDGHGPGGLVIRELKFDDIQTMKFETLRHQHHGAMMQFDERIHGLRVKMFVHLPTDAAAAKQVDSLIGEIADIQREKERITYHHLNMVRQMCKPDQQKIFDDMIKRPRAAGPDGPPPRD